MRKPFTDLAHKQLKFSWSIKSQQVLDTLDTKLINLFVLIVFDWILYSDIQCNVSNYTI